MYPAIEFYNRFLLLLQLTCAARTTSTERGDAEAAEKCRKLLGPTMCQRTNVYGVLERILLADVGADAHLICGEDNTTTTATATRWHRQSSSGEVTEVVAPHLSPSGGLLLRNVTPDDGGWYSCVSTTSTGGGVTLRTSRTHLLLEVPPILVIHYTSLAVGVVAVATFMVVTLTVSNCALWCSKAEEVVWAEPIEAEPTPKEAEPKPKGAESQPNGGVKMDHKETHKNQVKPLHKVE